MKHILLLISLLAISGCNPSIEESKASAVQCTMIGWYEIIEAKFKLNTPHAGPFKVSVNGHQITSNCMISRPCLNEISHEDPNTIKAVIFLDADDQPTKIDLALLDDVTPAEVLLEGFDVSLDWQFASYPNGAPECGVQDLAVLNLQE